MLVQRNLARTAQPVRPVLQTEITSVCVFPDLLAMIVNTVRILIHSITMSGLTQLCKENFDRRPRVDSSIPLTHHDP